MTEYPRYRSVGNNLAGQEVLEEIRVRKEKRRDNDGNVMRDEEGNIQFADVEYGAGYTTLEALQAEADHCDGLVAEHERRRTEARERATRAENTDVARAK